MKKFKLTNLPSPINFFNKINSNNVYLKRDDLSDLALGGNKVRKLEYFMADAVAKKADCIVTYGSPQSNHCRITAAASNKKGLKTVLILSESDNIKNNGNYFLYSLFDVELVWAKIDCVPETINKTLINLKKRGYNPYFIQGGGHGNLGTHAYRKAYEEILYEEKLSSLRYDYIFHASGTGTTQAGLIIGSMIEQDKTKIVGISVARNKKRGTDVIYDSIIEYSEYQELNLNILKENIIFDDSYVGKGYADIYPEIPETIKYVAKVSGVLLDPVYTGKAFYGMLDLIKKENIKGKNILFIHTGGAPLIFNYADKL